MCEYCVLNSTIPISGLSRSFPIHIGARHFDIDFAVLNPLEHICFNELDQCCIRRTITWTKDASLPIGLRKILHWNLNKGKKWLTCIENVVSTMGVVLMRHQTVWFSNEYICEKSDILSWVLIRSAGILPLVRFKTSFDNQVITEH